VFGFIEYPYFINPPTLRFANYDAIELELDFQENNIKGGDKIIKPKYYQLFYKVIAINQTTFDIYFYIKDENACVM